MLFLYNYEFMEVRVLIIIKFHDKVVWRQYQITDFMFKRNSKPYMLIRYRKVKIFDTIRIKFKKKRPAKYLYKKRLHKINQRKLNIYLQCLPNISFEKLNADESNLKPIKKRNISKKIKQIKEIKSLNFQADYSYLKNKIEFPTEAPYLMTRPYMHLSRFYHVPSTKKEDFCNTPLLTTYWELYQEVVDFTGLFQHMIALNSFEYWNAVEKEIRADGFHPKGFSVVEFIKWELLRHSMGIDSYSDATRIFENFNPEILKTAFIHPNRIPKPYHASHYYKWLKPEHFQIFFQKLVDDCVKYKVIIPRIAIADGLIFRTWAGNFTLDRWANSTDPQASITVHDKKFLGKCYNAIVFYAWCGKRWLPVDLRVVTGKTNENSVFQPIVDDFLQKSPYKWNVFLYDSGASSAENREFIKSQGLICGITARKNIKREVILDLGHKKFCFYDDIPDGMSMEQFKKLLNHRSQEEAGFSGFTTYHNMKQMNTTGHAAATIHVLKYMILQLLHALSAYKVNRPDLLMMYSAFSSLS